MKKENVSDSDVNINKKINNKTENFLSFTISLIRKKEVVNIFTFKYIMFLHNKNNDQCPICLEIKDMGIFCNSHKHMSACLNCYLEYNILSCPICRINMDSKLNYNWKKNLVQVYCILIITHNIHNLVNIS